MDDDLRTVEFRIMNDRTAAAVNFVREDGKSVVVTLTPDNLKSVITKLQTLYNQLVH